MTQSILLLRRFMMTTGLFVVITSMLFMGRQSPLESRQQATLFVSFASDVNKAVALDDLTPPKTMDDRGSGR